LLYSSSSEGSFLTRRSSCGAFGSWDTSTGVKLDSSRAGSDDLPSCQRQPFVGGGWLVVRFRFLW